MEDKNYTIALLIDSDNVSSKYINALMKELIALGRVTYKRMYGDFTTPAKSGWRDIVNQFSIMPVQQYSYTTGKNVTDSKMIIDAMDILYTGNVDAFCLMSSDSDFTGLAKRLKESNMFVIGAGESKTPGSFINACDRFFKLDSLTKHGQKTERNKAGESVQSSSKREKSKTAASGSAGATVPATAAVPSVGSAAGTAQGAQLSASVAAAAKKAAEARSAAKGTPVPYFRDEREEEPDSRRDEREEEEYFVSREEIEDFVVSLLEGSDRTELPLAFIMQKIFQAYPDFEPKDYGVNKASKFFAGKKFAQKKKGTEVLISLKDDS